MGNYLSKPYQELFVRLQFPDGHIERHRIHPVENKIQSVLSSKLVAGPDWDEKKASNKKTDVRIKVVAYNDADW